MLRSKGTHDFIGPSHELSSSTSMLPTGKYVMKHLMYLREKKETGMQITDVDARQCAATILSIWAKAGTPTIGSCTRLGSCIKAWHDEGKG